MIRSKFKGEKDPFLYPSLELGHIAVPCRLSVREHASYVHRYLYPCSVTLAVQYGFLDYLGLFMCPEEDYHEGPCIFLFLFFGVFEIDLDVQTAKPA